MRAVIAIVILDLKRFWVDRARLIVGLIQPLLYIFVLGAGIGAGSRMGGGGYQRFIFAGTLGLSLLFSATFAAVTIVFDRQIGFFKAVLVAPVPRPAIAIGKIVAGALQALAQGTIILPFAPIAGAPLGALQVVELYGAMVLASLTFSTMGVAIACRFNSTTVFPIVSNAVILPLFFLSGSLYQLSDSPRWMRIAAQLDPVAYAVDLMRGAVLGKFYFPVQNSLGALAVTMALLLWSAVSVFKRGEDDSALGATAYRWRR